MDNTTAKVSCFARAYHYVNTPVHIFANRAAQGLLGEDYDNIAQSMTQGISFFIPAVWNPSSIYDIGNPVIILKNPEGLLCHQD